MVDVDATVVIRHSEKEDAAKTWKKTSGFHPLLAFVDHGGGGTGEPVVALLRPGNAGSNTTADHVTVLEEALAQLPEQARAVDAHGRRAILVLPTRPGATHGFTARIAELDMHFSVGSHLHQFDIARVLALVPTQAWSPAYDVDGRECDRALVVEVTELVDLSAWPEDTRLILRKEPPHPGAQLRVTDHDGHSVTGITRPTGSAVCRTGVRLLGCGRSPSGLKSNLYGDRRRGRVVTTWVRDLVSSGPRSRGTPPPGATRCRWGATTAMRLSWPGA
ncbi:hypothetical protein GCM10012275_10780 [Longimycelium tulufanense]|uniref:Transposase DDE domain-containing protein n=1 Tax=Longimycelium tulufanense TaxID=907463 RepID=A0A8J3FV71_9PSEU|nr:transposase [Longimycelium tulufanense]GGM41631.1 hypothetical protein GCM10012275_10780 [Longimycelium tulufanense]